VLFFCFDFGVGTRIPVRGKCVGIARGVGAIITRDRYLGQNLLEREAQVVKN